MCARAPKLGKKRLTLGTKLSTLADRSQTGTTNFRRSYAVGCELAPISGNPGWFWIGWSRPFGTDDFYQLRRHILCWRVADIDKNGTPDLEEGWRINGEGLEHASMLGYQIFIDGIELLASQGNFHAKLLNLLETRQVSQSEHKTLKKNAQVPQARNETPCELAPILVRFLHPEIAIVGADLCEYGPFRVGDVVALPFIHAWIFIQNGTAEMFDGSR